MVVSVDISAHKAPIQKLVSTIQTYVPVDQSYTQRGQHFSPINEAPITSSFAEAMDDFAFNQFLGKQSHFKAMIHDHPDALTYVVDNISPVMNDMGFTGFKPFKSGGHSMTLLAQNANGTNYVVKLTDEKQNPDFNLEPPALPFVVQPITTQVVGGDTPEAQKYGRIKVAVYPQVKTIQPTDLEGKVETKDAMGAYKNLFARLQDLISLNLQVVNKRCEMRYGVNPGLHIDDLDNPDNYGFMPVIDAQGETKMLPVVLDAGHIQADPDIGNDMLEQSIRGYFPGTQTAVEQYMQSATDDKTTSVLSDIHEDMPWYDDQLNVSSYARHVPVPEQLKESKWQNRVGAGTQGPVNSVEDVLEALRSENGDFTKAQQSAGHRIS